MNAMESDPVLHPVLSGPSSSPILLDTLFLVLLRAVYFLLSRRFLLSTLNPTLRDLSKPETLLPPTVSSEPDSGRSRGRGRPQLLSAFTSDFDLDGELDTEDEVRETPSSSYPPSPSLKPAGSNASSSHSNRDPFLRRTTDEVSKQAKDLGHTSEAGTSQIELQTLGQRLKDVGTNAGRRVQVLELSHGRKDGSAGTRGIKKATRGLSRLAR